MKHKSKKIVSFLIALCIVSPALASEGCGVTSYISARSQSVDLMRQLIGVRGIVEELKCSEDCWPGYVASVTEFTSTFRSLAITRCLFGDSLLGDGCCQAIRISGSAVENRKDQDLLADYFGLPTDYQSVINFNPSVENVIGDLQGYFRLDNWLCGLYFYIHLPIVNTKWNLHVCEDVLNRGYAPYGEGYFGQGNVARSHLLNSFSEYVSGHNAPDLTGTNALGQTFHEDFARLQYSRWDSGQCGSKTKSTSADLRMWLGYDWINCECYSLGLGLIVAAPTGNKPEGQFLFEPIIGNGHHWELGGFVNGEYTFWQNCEGTDRVVGYTQANITHLFNAEQVRTFDLKGKPLSRYMLAEKLAENSVPPIVFGDGIRSDFRFADAYTPVANLTTFCVNVSSAVQVDWVAMATYSHCNFSWDLGYNLWYRSCEKIKLKNDCCNGIAPETWALKGDAHVYGFADATGVPLSANTPVALGATESSATIHRGTNGSSTVNGGIDNPRLATAQDFVNVTTFQTVNATSNSINNQTNTSIQSVFLSNDDIDFCSAGTKGFTNRVFTHFNYSWDCACWQPFFGLGAMGEFAANNCKKDSGSNCNTKDSCRNCSFSQWGVWIKSGFVF